MGVSSEVGVGSIDLLASDIDVFSVRYKESSPGLFSLVIVSSSSQVKMRSLVRFKVTISYLLILFMYLNMDAEYGLFPSPLIFAIAINLCRSNSFMNFWFSPSATVLPIASRCKYMSFMF